MRPYGDARGEEGAHALNLCPCLSMGTGEEWTGEGTVTQWHRMMDGTGARTHGVGWPFLAAHGMSRLFLYLYTGGKVLMTQWLEGQGHSRMCRSVTHYIFLKDLCPASPCQLLEDRWRASPKCGQGGWFTAVSLSPEPEGPW